MNLAYRVFSLVLTFAFVLAARADPKFYPRPGGTLSQRCDRAVSKQLPSCDAFVKKLRAGEYKPGADLTPEAKALGCDLEKRNELFRECRKAQPRPFEG